MLVSEVEKEVRVLYECETVDELKKYLKAMGVETKGLTHSQMVDKLVELEVYAFTH